MPDMPEETQQKISQLQLFEQSLQNVLIQKQQFQAQLLEIESALKEIETAKETYSGDRYTIRRYRKIRGDYMQQSKFNISSADQARKIIDALNGWIDE